MRWEIHDEAPPAALSDDGFPPWVIALLGGFVVYEAFAIRRGLRDGRIAAPRGLDVATRVEAPTKFALYIGMHGIFAAACLVAFCFGLFDWIDAR